MAPFDEVHLAHATAPALHGPWTKQPFALDRRSRLGRDAAVGAARGAPRRHATGCTTAPAAPRTTEYRIHLATSDDAWTWTRHPANPLIVDGYEARDPMVQRVGDRWVLYYTATSEPAGGHHVVAAAESDDLVHWSGRRIVYTDPMEGTMAGPTESPFVVERDGRWYLLIGPDWRDAHAARSRRPAATTSRAYRRTRVLASDDPLALRPRRPGRRPSTPTPPRSSSTSAATGGSPTAAGARAACTSRRSPGR